MAALKVRIGNQEAEVDFEDLTTGEMWFVEREYGVSIGAQTAEGKPWSVLLASAALALKRLQPELSERQIKTRLESTKPDELEISQVSEADPTEAATRAGGDQNGDQAKTPKRAGTPRSSKPAPA